MGLRLGNPAQDAAYLLTLGKTNGYNNGSQIRGAFRAGINGPLESVRSVEYQLDGQQMAIITQSPFSYNFSTTTYATGWHTLGAIVMLNDGSQVSTPTKRFEFVSAEVEAAFFRNFVVPVVGGVLLLSFLAVGFQYFARRGQTPSRLAAGAQRHYGIKGGGICPHCKRPFSLHWWSANLVSGVFDRCDYCGKWSFVRFASLEQLRAAEQAELADAQQGQTQVEKTEEEKLKDLLDQSKFTKS